MRKFILFTFFIIFINTLFFCLQGYSATYYMDPNTGNDGNAGTKALPWKTLTAKVNTLTAGDTLFLRGGIYFERITITAAGSADKPIRVIAYPGETPIIDGGSEGKAFRVTPNNLWTMYGTSTNTYVSTNTYTTGISSTTYGYLGPENGGYQLNAYDNINDLMAVYENETGTTAVRTYCGPGLHYDSGTGKIYCRLQNSAIQTYMGLEYPTNIDPRQTPLYLFGDGAVVLFDTTAAFFSLEGIEIRYQKNALRFNGGANDINIKNCYIMAGRTPCYINDEVYNLLFENCKFVSNIPGWISWTDVKSKRATDDSQIAGNYQGAAIDIQGDSNNIEVAYCTFDNVFDGVNPIDNAYNIHVHDNVFTGIRDDCMQIGTAVYDVNVHHNKMIGVSKACSTDDFGNAASGNRGKVYIHHNIIDTSTKFRGGRAKTNNGLGDGSLAGYDIYDDQYGGVGVLVGTSTVYDGMVWARPFGDHSTPAESVEAPWKIYNNTIKYGRDLSNHGSGAEYRFTFISSGAYHEVYNNIMIQTYDFRYLRDIQINNSISHSIYDGNLYWYPGTGTAYASQRFQVKNNTTETDYASLSAMRSAVKSITDDYYAPGWEASGVEGDPGLDSQYYPTNNNARIGGIDLSSKGWPGVDGGIYRGALKPK